MLIVDMSAGAFEHLVCARLMGQKCLGNPSLNALAK